MCQFFVLIPTMLRCGLNLEGQEPKKKITKWRLLFVIWLCLVSLTTIAIEAEEQDIESLINALTDESEDVRGSAAFALGRIGEPAKEAVPALINALTDESEDVRDGAVWALKILGYESDNIHPSTAGIRNPAKDNEKYHFRKTRWGMSRKQVTAVEKAEFSTSTEDRLIYQGSVNGLVCGIYYIFIKNQLVSTGYMFLEDHSNENDYINDFKSIKKILTKKYGSPKHDIESWDNELFKDDSAKWGFAVSVGHLSYLSSWETNETEINLGLNGDNFEVGHVLSYDSKFFKKTVEAEAEEEDFEDF